MNRQRQVIYEQRKRVLKGDELWADLEDMVEEVAEIIVAECIDEKAHPDEWNIEGLDELVYKQFSLRLGLKERVRQMSVEQIVEEISQAAMAHLRAKEERFSAEVMSYLIKMIMLQSIDNHWKDHLLMMEPPAGGDWAPRLRAEGSRSGISEGRLRDVYGYDRADQTGCGGKTLHGPGSQRGRTGRHR